MHRSLLPLLACPACHGNLIWSILAGDEVRIEEGVAGCAACGARYPLREGIAAFLTPDLARDDLWEQAESGLGRFLRQNPDTADRLLNAPLASLAPADQFYRAMALEERGDYLAASQAEEVANAGIYSPDYRRCWESQQAHVLARLEGQAGPVVDLASGRGYLVRRLAGRLAGPIVATDFSPSVLRRDRRRLEALGLYERVSLLACDARRLPFKTSALQTMTTNLGLPNIAGPELLLPELRRVVGGEFLAISVFYPADDDANIGALRQLGLSDLSLRQATLQRFAAAGWSVELANPCAGLALPTPTGVLLDGAQIDALPVAPTRLEWCTLVAR